MNRPIFLLGHSMGGALSLRYALQYGEKLTALILSAPAVALDGAPWLLKQLSKFLSVVLPKLGVLPIDPSLVSRDPEMVDSYAADPLNYHGKLPVRTLAEIVRCAEWLPTQLERLKMPVLLLHGGEDKIVGLSGSRVIQQRISSEDKTLLVYNGLYHEIFNELPADRAIVINDLTTWTKRHIGN